MTVSTTPSPHLATLLLLTFLTVQHQFFVQKSSPEKCVIHWIQLNPLVLMVCPHLCWNQQLQSLHLVSLNFSTCPYQLGIFPQPWKMLESPWSSNLPTHLFQKNYQPISILPIVSKLLERHVYSLVSTFYQIKNLYPNLTGDTIYPQ